MLSNGITLFSHFIFGTLEIVRLRLAKKRIKVSTSNTIVVVTTTVYSATVTKLMFAAKFAHAEKHDVIRRKWVFHDGPGNI